ncbi:MAG TPA: hypothetical protein VG778_06585, partial [Blastocatellia bacterium]|nr:hypothetical protein [Blastocatellia bacterium]
MRFERIKQIISAVVMTATLLIPTLAQERASSTGPKPAAALTGTKDRIAKYMAAGVLGDSYISEDKFGNVSFYGNVGIGTSTPTSPLTVQGTIEITTGGLKFPDGTMQTTAPVAPEVFHNSTLTGKGTETAPLAVAVPLNLTGTGTVLSVEST